nr:MAG TPA: hypothetical protein [Caudoviricetes sp.]
MKRLTQSEMKKEVAAIAAKKAMKDLNGLVIQERKKTAEETDAWINHWGNVFYAAMILSLHRQFRFGAERCSKAIEGADKIVEQYCDGKITVQDLKNMIRDETGLVVDDWDGSRWEQ